MKTEDVRVDEEEMDLFKEIVLSMHQNCIKNATNDFFSDG